MHTARRRLRACERADSDDAGAGCGLQELEVGNDFVARKAVRAIKDRTRQLKRLLKTRKTYALGLQALTDLNLPEARPALEKALDEASGGKLYEVVQIVTSQPHESWSNKVVQVFRRLSPCGAIWESFGCFECAEYLLRGGHNASEIRTKFKRFRREGNFEAAMLASSSFPTSRPVCFAVRCVRQMNSSTRRPRSRYLTSLGAARNCCRF